MTTFGLRQSAALERLRRVSLSVRTRVFGRRSPEPALASLTSLFSIALPAVEIYAALVRHLAGNDLERCIPGGISREKHVIGASHHNAKRRMTNAQCAAGAAGAGCAGGVADCGGGLGGAAAGPGLATDFEVRGSVP